MLKKSYRGEKLLNWSFKNDDLSNFDFSDCDLRGTDFSGSNLTNAKFCHAKLGDAVKNRFSEIWLQLQIGIISILASLTTGIGITLIVQTVQTKHSQIIIGSLLTTILASIVILLSIGLNRIKYIFQFFASIIIVLLIVGFIKDELNILLILSDSLFMGLLSSIIMVSSIMTIIALSVGNQWTFILSVVIEAWFIITINVSSDKSGTLRESPIDTSAMILPTIIFMFLYFYISRISINEKYSQLAYFRKLNINFKCLKGTKFYFANLQGCDFSGADLKYTSFKDAKINRCNFKNAKNHHLALTEGTPLEPRKVRDLVIDGIITDKNFSTLDLRGLDFSNLNLEDFDFSHANLCGTNLSNTKMTGAILESWNIDTETILNNIECKYYFYLENGKKKRMPPEGEEYKAGEFSRIFQKITNTIDFIAHNEMELAAIKLSVEQVRVESGNDAIHIQAIEEKDGFIVVKVTAPKNEDRGVLYHEINTLKQEYEIKIQALMADNYIQIGKIEVLKEQLKEQREVFLNKIEGKIIMNNPNISTTITDSTVHGSVATAEKIEHSFNTIQQLPAENIELKELLIQLQNLINNSALSDTAKQKALNKTQEIAEVSKKPKAEQKNLVEKTLGYFNGLSDSLETGTEIALKLGETIAKIASLFSI